MTHHEAVAHHARATEQRQSRPAPGRSQRAQPPRQQLPRPADPHQNAPIDAARRTKRNLVPLPQLPDEPERRARQLCRKPQDQTNEENAASTATHSLPTSSDTSLLDSSPEGGTMLVAETNVLPAICGRRGDVRPTALSASSQVPNWSNNWRPTSPGERVCAAMPEPMTSAARNAEPISSASSRRASGGGFALTIGRPRRCGWRSARGRAVGFAGGSLGPPPAACRRGRERPIPPRCTARTGTRRGSPS